MYGLQGIAEPTSHVWGPVRGLLNLFLLLFETTKLGGDFNGVIRSCEAQDTGWTDGQSLEETQGSRWLIRRRTCTSECELRTIWGW